MCGTSTSVLHRAALLNNLFLILDACIFFFFDLWYSMDDENSGVTRLVEKPRTRENDSVIAEWLILREKP